MAITIDIYTTPFCPFCYRAKALLTAKGATFNEIDVMMSPARRREMRDRAGGLNTVPQIFIGGRHIGGSDELAELDRRGELEALLAPSAQG